MVNKTENVIAVINDAFKKANEACQAMIDANPNVWYPCGFSWVKIKPARGPYVKALKAMGKGKNDSYEGGFQVYNPSGNYTQWMDAKLAGSEAFAKALRAHGVDAVAVSRMD